MTSFTTFSGALQFWHFFLFSTQMVKTRITQRRDAVMKQPAFSRCHRFFNPTHTSFVAWWIGFCRHSELWRACGRALLHKVLAPRPCAVSRGEPRERGANSRQQHRESLIAEFGCRWEQPMRLSSIQRPDLPGDNFPQRQLFSSIGACRNHRGYRTPLGPTFKARLLCNKKICRRSKRWRRKD